MARQVNMAGTLPTFTRDDFTKEENKVYNIPLERFKVSSSMAALPTAGNNTSLGLVAGTHGTAGSSLQGSDFDNTTKTETARVEYTLPPEYVPGDPVYVQVRAGTLTNISNSVATVDVEVYKKTDRSASSDAGIGSDLVTTAATSCNSLTLANIDFSVTPTGLTAGDVLDIEITASGTDSSVTGVTKIFIDRVGVKTNIRA